MKRSILTFAVMALLTGFSYFAGCSDEDTSTGSTTKTPGDTLNPVFMGAAGAFMDAGETFYMGFEWMALFLNEFTESIPVVRTGDLVALSGAVQPDTIYYDEGSKYWIAITDFSSLSWLWHRRDSIQFLSGTTITQYPNTVEMTQMNGGANVLEAMLVEPRSPDSTAVFDTVFKYNFKGSVIGEPGSISQMGDVEASASGTIYRKTLFGKQSDVYCMYEMDNRFSTTGVELNIFEVFENNGCPHSGSVTHNMSLKLDCFNDVEFTNTDNWYMKETFAGDTIHYLIENSLYRWEFSEPCLNR